MVKSILKLSFIILFLAACKKEDNSDIINEQKTDKPITQTPYALNLPPHFVYIDRPQIPIDNPLTVEGIALGKKLYYEKKLSKGGAFDGLACASCHLQSQSFSSNGGNNTQVIPHFNLAWPNQFLWNGKIKGTLEDVMLFEVDDFFQANLLDIKSDPEYQNMYKSAFGNEAIDSKHTAYALAQFLRTLVSGDSKADNEIKKRNGIAYTGQALNAQEKRGYELFISEGKGDCMHCHGIFPNPLWTDFEYRNNGLDANPDSGLAQTTRRASDVGKFKTPSLRNLVFTSPYMHDGRFQTLEEVIDFYTSGVRVSPTIDPTLLKNRNLTPTEKLDLIAFLKAITDSTFVTNPAFSE
ncbi:MAG: cytochrome-c peroxidase [Bacteroidetes bacterium]|nr:MAG: cytochrome-c peroxidase [Bacteroidota bacterium]MBL1146004.1 cytochrome-c peroxidase [Bacteroidota bacterium]NOG58798.1 cytochrome-c peroxidase [Bacteroidota bacterium]